MTDFNDYDIVDDSQINENTYFIVMDRYFFRNKSRASLSIVITEDEFGHAKIEAIGSGGGRGLIFSFDWGAGDSFESSLTYCLENHEILYKEE